jgi:hypothetical protein
MNNLQKSLAANTVFSGLSGLMLITFSKNIATLFAVSEPLIFTVIGFALLFFTGTILLEIKKQRLLGILWIISQDVLWVLASIYCWFQTISTLLYWQYHYTSCGFHCIAFSYQPK